MGCDAILIHPLYTRLQGNDKNMGLEYIAAYSRAKGRGVEILGVAGRGWTVDQVSEYVKSQSPLLAGVSILSQEGAGEALDLIKKLREKDLKSHIIVGGIFPSFEYTALLSNYPEIDTVCIGEGEITFYHLLEALSKGGDLSQVEGIAYRVQGDIITTKQREPVMDLDVFPFPARDMLLHALKYRNYASIISGRGCFGKCNVCSANGFYSSMGVKYRYRKPERVVDEIEYLIKTYGVKRFAFDDTNFMSGGILGKRRAREFTEVLSDRGIFIEYGIRCRSDDVERELFTELKNSGLVRVYLEVGSGSQPQLDRYAEGLRVEDNLLALQVLADLGMFVEIDFTMFDQGATVEDIIANRRFLAKVKGMFPKGRLGGIDPASKLVPLSGSKYMEKLKAAGELKCNYPDYYYDFADRKVRMMYGAASVSSALVKGVKGMLGSGRDREAGFPEYWLV